MARNALGRGLSALIREPGLATDVPGAGSPPGQPQGAATATAPALAPGNEAVIQVDIDIIDPSPHQPRLKFSEAAMEELAASITASGILQPVLLRRKGTRYELIAGERRWRAAQRASMKSVPAIVRNVPDERAVEMTLIENLQREDLNPLEEAMAFDRLSHDFGMTQEQIAERTGKNRSTISNSLRLLRLDPQVKKDDRRGPNLRQPRPRPNNHHRSSRANRCRQKSRPRPHLRPPNRTNDRQERQSSKARRSKRKRPQCPPHARPNGAKVRYQSNAKTLRRRQRRPPNLPLLRERVLDHPLRSIDDRTLEM